MLNGSVDKCYYPTLDHAENYKMSYFILLIGRGTKYRTRSIITSPACQVHRRSSHPTPPPCVSTVIRHRRGHSNRPPFLYFSKKSSPNCHLTVEHFRHQTAMLLMTDLVGAQRQPSSAKLFAHGKMLIRVPIVLSGVLYRWLNQ